MLFFFGATRAQVSSASATMINVTVPRGATYQYISVTNLDTYLTARTAYQFAPTFTCGTAAIDQNSFEETIYFSTGEGASDLSIGDLDGDGKSDIVVVNSAANTLSVYRNLSIEGTISLAAAINYLTGAVPTTVSIGDLDGDGKPDIAVTNNSSTTISIFRNKSVEGTISFAEKIDYESGPKPSKIAIGDLDGDGRLDMAVSNYGSGSVSVFRNISVINEIQFVRAKVLETGPFSSTVSIADMDGDNLPDIIEGHQTETNKDTRYYYLDPTLSIFRNTSLTPGETSFGEKLNISNMYITDDLLITDIEGSDGKPDVLGSHILLTNTSSPGNISFSKRLFQQLDGITLGTIDGDSRPDVVSLNQIFKNNSTVQQSYFGSNGTLSTAADVISTFNFYDAAVADVDGDGASDIVGLPRDLNKISILRSRLYSNVPAKFSTTEIASGDTLRIQLPSVMPSQLQWAAVDNPTVTGESVSSQPGGTIADKLINQTNDIQTVTYLITGGCKPEGESIQVNVLHKAPPIVHAFSPLSGAIGETVIIMGENFGQDPSSKVVLFGSIRAAIVSINDTAITVSVPTGTSTSQISVNDILTHLTALSSESFSVTIKCVAKIHSSSFPSNVDFQVGANPNSLHTADLDGDGKSDLVIVDKDSMFVSIVRNSSTNSTISFNERIDFPTNKKPYDTSIGDLTGDGKPDIIIANGASKTISILKNTSSTGSVSFLHLLELPFVNNPKIILVKDMDQDRRPDIVMASVDSKLVSIFRNISTHEVTNFSVRADFNVGTLAVNTSLPNVALPLAIDDIDGDDYPDLVVASGSIVALRNTSRPGTISFGARAAVFSDAEGSIIIADFNADGKADVAINTGYMRVLKNVSTGGAMSFSPYQTYSTASFPGGNEITSGDFNGDGAIEIATFRGESIAVNENVSENGAVSFDSQVSFRTGKNPYRIVVADFNGDGSADIINTNYDNSISILKNEGIGPLVLNPPQVDIFSGDAPDITLTANIPSTFMWQAADNPNTTGEIITPQTTDRIAHPIVIETGSIQSIVYSVTATSEDGLCVGKQQSITVNVLSRPPVIRDIIPAFGAAGSDVTIVGTYFNPSAYNNTVFFGGVQANIISASSSELVVKIPKGATDQFISVTDKVSKLTATFNKSFVVIPECNTSLDETSRFTEKRFSDHTFPFSLAISDLNGDGKPDICSVGSNNTLSILENTTVDGTISFSKIPLESTDSPTDVLARDFDGDGKPDLFVTMNQLVSIRLNTSTADNISFSTSSYFTFGFYSQKLIIEDVDGDGRLDAVLPNTFSNTISVLKNSSKPGKISFDMPISFLIGSECENFKMSDVDGDGKPDIIAVNRKSNTVSILRNTSTVGVITFAAKVDLVTSNSPSMAYVNDFDVDGMPDVAVVNMGSNTVSVFKNVSVVGAISFGLRQDYSTVGKPNALTSADVNGDGKPELIVSYDGYVNTLTISLFKNLSTPGNALFDAKIDITTDHDIGMGRKSVIKSADFNADGSADIVTVSDRSIIVFSGQPCIVTDIEDQAEYVDDISIFPNPSNGIFIVKSQTTEISTVEIVDGRGVIRFFYRGDILTIKANLEKESNGIYFLRVTKINGAVTVRKIIVQK